MDTRCCASTSSGFCGTLVSSIPLAVLAKMLHPGNAEVEAEARALKLRVLILVFLVLDQPRVVNDHWIFFPEREYPFSRMFEQKAIDAGMGPADRTAVCCDFTFGPGDEISRSPDRELVRRCLDGLVEMGLTGADRLEASLVKRVRGFYPVYTVDYRERLRGAYDRLRSASNLLLTGRLGMFNYNRKEQLNRIRRQALDTMIEEKLMDHEIKRVGIKVPPREVEVVIDDAKKQNKATQEDLERALAKEGMTFEQYKTQIEQRILRTKLVQFFVKVEPNLSEKQLRDFYEQNADRYRTPETLRPAHILFRIPKEAPPEKVQEVRKKCQEVLDRIRKGEDFGEMALLYSQDPSAKDRGDLGYFKKGELLPAFEKELARLRVGEVGGIIRTEFGFHLVKLLENTAGTSLKHSR